MTTSVEPPTTPSPSEPPNTLSDPKELLAGYLDYYRATILHKLDGMSEDDLRSSRLPSGWTPLGLLRHLTFVELRWLRWGFLAEEVEEPWGDEGPGGVWALAPGETTGQVPSPASWSTGRSTSSGRRQPQPSASAADQRSASPTERGSAVSLAHGARRGPPRRTG